VKYKKEFNMKKIFLIIIILAFALSMHALLCLNDLNCIFSDSPEKSLIEDNVILGATHFLNSKSNADLLLMEYEKSGRQEFNFTLALEYVEKAIAELESSKEKYVKAAEIGERLGYIETRQTWFKEFSYDTFIVENNFNQEIAGVVKNYLMKGDILGVYRHNINNIDGLLNVLYSIREKLKANIKPEISAFWFLLERYAENALFGNYASRLGRHILNNCEG
jgi:hypothetical protein